MYKRLLVLALAVLLGAATSVLMVLYVGLKQVRQTERAIIQEATRNNWLTTVTETAVYAGENEYRIAKGLDSQGREKWVWFNEDELYETFSAGLLSAEDALNEARRLYPEGRIVRLTPGLFKQRPVWVIFLQERPAQQYVYLYLQMTDGTVIRELKLH